MIEDVLDVLVLGPVECRAGRRPLAVPRLLERALLVRLALAHGSPVPDERLATDLWGDEARDRPTERLRVVVSRLRMALGEHAMLLARSPAGYALRAATPDAAGAEAAAARLAGANRKGDPVAALSAATEALAHWRGPALSDLRTVKFGRMEGERLDGWHTDLTVQRLQAKLEMGAAAEMLAELSTLATEHRLNERIWGMLARALYSAGRQAEALERLARLRRALADELGIDPTPDTAELELRILRHDPGLLIAAADEPPAPAVVSRRRTWLPAPRTEFVGRDGELAAVLEQLSEPGLITLVGVAGSGKSRLATEVARGVEQTGRPVVFVELAPLQRPGSVVAALADTLGTDPDGGADPLQAIAAALAGAVLVLDNAEHLVDQVSDVVAQLLARSRGLTVLVTSQRALLLADENQHRIGPLPPATAAALFVARTAGSARPDPADVATICAAVDSLPLGIELAAGLTRTLTVAQLARRVNDRLRLLVGGSRDAGGRHTSLRAALDWSYELLEAPEQAVLRRLGVFTGGFTLEAAEQVANVADVPEALADLADRSLIAAVPEAGSTRFRLLETVREYAQAKLTAHGEMEDARAAHLAWCLRFTQALDTDNVASVEAVTAVFGEWPNLRDALENAPGTPRAGGALQLANTLHTAWVARGWFPEARRHLTTLAATPYASPLDRARAFCNAGFHALMALRLDDAAALLDDAAAIMAGPDAGIDEELTLTIRYHRGFVDLQRCRLAEATEILDTGRRLAHDLGLRKREAGFADALGTVRAIAGDSAAAEQHYREAAAIDRERGDEHRLSIRLANLAQVLADIGRGEEALAAAEESHRYARQIDDRQLLPVNHMTRATVALNSGRLKDAESLGRDALALSDGVDGSIWADFADVLVAAGELDEARELLEIAYSDLPSEGVAWLAARPISAALALASGDVDTARRIVEQTEQSYAALGFGWPRYTGRLAQVRRHLDALS